jgi:hypothetical protein
MSGAPLPVEGGIDVQSILRTTCLGFLVVFMAGCESTRLSWLKREPAGELPNKAGAPPTTVALVAYLNDNAGRVRSLRVDDLAIDASIGNQTFGLVGCRMFAEKPRNFRMKAAVFGKGEVDIGSNAQEFWFWAAKNPDPYQFFCTYRDLDEGRIRMMPLPIQPEWVMETMGLGPYGPAGKYQLETDLNVFRLVEKAKSPQGQPVRKVIVMNRTPVHSPQPQVTDYLLLNDATGQEICSAHIISTSTDRVTGAILPYKMELRMPAQKMKLFLKMDGLALNTGIDTKVFERQPMTGVQPFNLATGQVETPGLQRAQGITPTLPR